MDRKTLVNGFTMIEVLICVAILSFGIISLTELQTRSLRVAENNMQRSQAIWIVSSIAEGIKNNIEGLDNLHYQNAASSVTNDITNFCGASYNRCNTVSCSAEQISNLEMFWNLCENRNLINLAVTISCNPSCASNADIDVSLAWDSFGNTDINNRQQVNAFTKYP
jgi:type IV pilus modification protein PilV